MLEPLWRMLMACLQGNDRWRLVGTGMVGMARLMGLMGDGGYLGGGSFADILLAN